MVAFFVSQPFCLCSCYSFPRWSSWHHHVPLQFCTARTEGLGPPTRFGLPPTLRSVYTASPGLVNDSKGQRDHFSQKWDFDRVANFIDDNLIKAVMQKDGGIRQVVLLTDGMDQRPYRLPWPPSTLIFLVSFGPVFKPVKGAELPKNCLFRQISIDFGEAADLEEEWPQRLRKVGYQGDKPSIWAMQGLENLRPHSFQHVLMGIGRAAMKGSSFVGELPITAVDCPNEETARRWLEKTFLKFGLSPKSMSFKQVAECDDGPGGVYISFVAEQLHLSDEQFMKASREIELAEEAGDEEAFEDW